MGNKAAFLTQGRYRNFDNVFLYYATAILISEIASLSDMLSYFSLDFTPNFPLI